MRCYVSLDQVLFCFVRRSVMFSCILFCDDTARAYWFISKHHTMRLHVCVADTPFQEDTPGIDVCFILLCRQVYLLWFSYNINDPLKETHFNCNHKSAHIGKQLTHYKLNEWLIKKNTDKIIDLLHLVRQSFNTWRKSW